MKLKMPFLSADTVISPANDFAITLFGQGLKRFSCHISAGDIRHNELGRRIVVWKLRDGHCVILPHGQVPDVNLLLPLCRQLC
jgi:hypothetical protein